MQRLQPELNEATGAPAFKGWSRMALRIESFQVIDVARPAVGDVKPASVTAELVIDLKAVARGEVRREWDELKEHDVVRFCAALCVAGRSLRRVVQCAAQCLPHSQALHVVADLLARARAPRCPPSSPRSF